MLEDIVKNKPKQVMSDCTLIKSDAFMYALNTQTQIDQYYNRIICGIIIELIEHIDNLLIKIKQDDCIKHEDNYRLITINDQIKQAKIKHFNCDYMNALKDYYDILQQLINITYKNNLLSSL